jgi:hypothetical protein
MIVLGRGGITLQVTECKAWRADLGDAVDIDQLAMVACVFSIVLTPLRGLGCKVKVIPPYTAKTVFYVVLHEGSAAKACGASELASIPEEFCGICHAIAGLQFVWSGHWITKLRATDTQG